MFFPQAKGITEMKKLDAAKRAVGFSCEIKDHVVDEIKILNGTVLVLVTVIADEHLPAKGNSLLIHALKGIYSLGETFFKLRLDEFSQFQT